MNGTFLYLWLREMQSELVKRFVDDIRIQERLVQVVCGKKSLYISLYPETLALCLDRKNSKDYSTLASLSTLVRGHRIEYIKQDCFTPVFHIGLQQESIPGSERTEIVVMLYCQAPNFLIIRGSRRRKLFSRIVEKKPKHSLWDVSPHTIEELYTGDHEQVEKKMLRTYEGIDKNLAEELTPERIRCMQQIVHGKAWVKPRLVSIKPLKVSFFAEDFLKEHDTLNNLLRYAINEYMRMKRRDRIADEKKNAVRNLKRRINRLTKKLQTPPEIERYRIMGDCILANLSSIKKGEKEVILPGPSHEGTYTIPLDPRKSPQENAQQYFRRYKKLKRGQPQIREKIKRLQQELTQIQAGKQKPVQSIKEQSTQRTSNTTRYRMFHLDSGSDVYVGKNARSNEELTFSFAKPHDYFFHVRGYQGSHVILRSSIKRGEKPPEKNIETAASIAAYYSKAKKQKRVPVSYTQRKYLKKSKKGKSGTVVLMREQVIFVDPALPAERVS